MIEPPELARSVAKAERVLRDELRQGCTDRLVRGGLDGFVRFWVGEMQGLRPPAQWLTRAEQVSELLAGYAAALPSERYARLKEALGLLSTGAPTREGRPATPGPNGRAHTAPPRPPAAPPRPTPTPEAPAPPLQTRPAAPKAATTVERHSPDAPLESIKGIGPVRAKALARLGLRRWCDLPRHFPNRHEYYPAPRPASELLFLQKASYEGVVRDVQVAVLNRGLRKLTVRLADPTGQVAATWLRAGFAGPKMEIGQQIAVSGNVVSFGRQVIFENPDWEPAEAEPVHTRRMVPVYPLTNGIHLYWLRGLIHRAVRSQAPTLEDHLPEPLRAAAGVEPLGRAIEQAHFPESPETLERARRRLAFDELFLLQLVVLQRRLSWQGEGGRALEIPREAIGALLGAQPFRLTGAQARVVAEINADLERPVPMGRLLQGEVGSGKTAVAAVALYAAVANGAQGILMAPTEILAEQHHRTLTAFYDRAAEALRAIGQPVPRVVLLTGSATRRQKEATYLAVREGEIDLLVGTHAVIQEGVEPRDLALAVVDEQHRFGVRQRVGIREKGQNPHLLVMTATPIPRTLALTMHGDLDLSMIDEMPPGRQPIKTHLLLPFERPLAYEHVRREADKGRQAFLICPLVEDSPHLEARAATEEYERLRTGELSGLRLALLHGRMKPADKDDVMRRFRAGEFDVLVSTSVVEVGVDVPNATVMLIEGAERFGLAQLHQFRGRVGRGEHPSTCILLTDAEEGEAVERLNMLVRSDNGLDLAEYDLRQRGPGDFLGVRQSGLPELRVATLNDVGLVEQARRVAAQVLDADPRLETMEHAALAARVAAFVHRVGEPN